MSTSYRKMMIVHVPQSTDDQDADNQAAYDLQDAFDDFESQLVRQVAAEDTFAGVFTGIPAGRSGPGVYPEEYHRQQQVPHRFRDGRLPEHP
eukprot:12613375-Heterocapsa_arctica.AAC.1